MNLNKRKMKKLFYIITILFVFFSCQQEIKTSTPSLQAEKDNVFWRAKDAKVNYNSNGSITISAYSSYEIVTLTLPSPNPGTYTLGVDTNTYATYTYTLNGITKHYETGVSLGNGQVIIKPSTAPGTFTGTFRFNAEDEDGEVINYNKGVFYQIPVF